MLSFDFLISISFLVTEHPLKNNFGGPMRERKRGIILKKAMLKHNSSKKKAVSFKV